MIRKKMIIEKPALLQEWDFEKNKDLRPDDFTGGSDQKIWWKCNLGHSWEAQVKSRVIAGTNCPVCAGKKVLAGFNDLQTTNPRLAAEWDFEKNIPFLPTEFTMMSNKKFWWKCRFGHSWETSVNHRSRGNGCPVCSGHQVLIGFNDLKTVKPHLIPEWDYEENGVLLPEHFTAGANDKVSWKCKAGHKWRAVISSRSQGKNCPYCTGKQHIPGVGDLQSVNPNLAKEWDYDKNSPLLPSMIAPNDHRRIWWKCSLGHSWEAQVNNRNHGADCPYCTNRRVLKGFNDLLHIDPEVCKQWDYEANKTLHPDEVLAGSAKKAYWKCDKGHSYKAGIVHRRNGSGCPVCAGKVIIPGDNDLKTLCPEIAADWDYDKNGSLLPDHVPVQSTKKVWWRCKHGHSYESMVYNRFNGNGCPYCSGNLPILGENDFATVHPELLSEWDYEKNKTRKPESYTLNSNTKVWWKCERGHSWLSSVHNRHNGNGCPHCIGKIPMRTRLV